MGNGRFGAVAAESAVSGETLVARREMARAAVGFGAPGEFAERGRAVRVRRLAGDGTVFFRIKTGGFGLGERANGFLMHREGGADGNAP